MSPHAQGGAFRMRTRTGLRSRLTIRVVGLVVLAGVFFGANPARAQEMCPLLPGTTPPEAPPVTAQQVAAGAAPLMEFAVGVRNQFGSLSAGIETVGQALYVGCLVRQEGGPYRSGSTYVVTLTPHDGRVFVHAKDMALSGRLLDPFVFGTILHALGVAQTDLVNLASDDPRTAALAQAAVFNVLLQQPDGAFDATVPVPGLRPGIPGASGHAAVYLSGALRIPFVVLAGFDLDASHVVEEEIDYGSPAVTAEQVVDRKTLKAFVNEAGNFVRELQLSGDIAASSQARIALRDENGPWRHGAVYLYILDRVANVILFHGAFPDRFELKPLIPTVRDVVTGELVLSQVLEAAASGPEGGFVEYYWDDPSDDTDSADVPKVGYAREFSGVVRRADGSTWPVDLVVGSGYYVTSPDGELGNLLQVVPYFANGDGVSSEVVLMNTSAHPIRPLVYMDGPDGATIDPETVVDLVEGMEVTEDGILTFAAATPPLGRVAVSTHGRGDPVNGSVKLVADGAIAGMLRMDVRDVDRAILEAGAPVGDAVFPVERREGGLTTGFAVHNLEAYAMELGCRLMTAGAVLEEVTIPLDANGQASAYIEETFTAADTSDFAGSMRCTAPGGGRFAAIAIEIDTAGGIVTAVPVMEVADGRAEAADLDFTHFVNGDGMTSDLVFVNLETRVGGRLSSPFERPVPRTRPMIYFHDLDGAPIAPATLVDLADGLEVTADGALTVSAQMAPLGVLTIATHGRGNLVTGSARVVSHGPVGGMLRYDLPHLGQSIVGASAPVGDAVFEVRRREGGVTTGVALHNLEAQAVEVRCMLMRGGAVLEDVPFPLGANGQTSWVIEDAFTAADVHDFSGMMRCTAPAGSRFTVIAVEADPADRILAAAPVIPLEAAAPEE